jgi:hypothetical protein
MLVRRHKDYLRTGELPTVREPVPPSVARRKVSRAPRPAPLAFFVTALAVWHGAFFAIGYRLTADDVLFLHLWMEGPRAIWSFTDAYAIGQGRIGFYLLMPLNILGSWLSGFAAARVAIVVLYLLVPALFAIYAARLLMAWIALPVFLVWLVLDPLAFEHMPPVAYPLQNTIPLLIVLGCRIERLAARQGDGASRLRTVASYLLFTLAMIATEFAGLFAMAILGGEWLLRLAVRREKEGSLYPALRSLVSEAETLLEAGSVITMLGLYAGFRLLHPSAYDGNSMDGISAIGPLIETTFRHLLAGTVLPRIRPRNLSGVPAVGWLASLVAGCAMAAAWIPALRGAATGRLPVMAVIVYGILAATLVTLPISGTQKQQLWCVSGSTCGYLDSRISALCVTLVLAFAAVSLVGHVQAQRRPFARAVLGLAAGLVFTLTSVHNWHVSHAMTAVAAAWSRANELSCFPELQPQDPELFRILVDPDRRIPFHPGADQAGFWRLYLDRADRWSECPSKAAEAKTARARITGRMPLITTGEVVRISDQGGSRFLGPGWSNIEPWGVWSNSSTAVLFVMPRGLLPTQETALILDFDLYFDDQLTRQKVEIEVGGNVLWTREVSRGEARGCCQAAITLSANQRPKWPIRIALHVANPHSPRPGTDGLLGIALHGISLVPLDR